MTENPSTLIQKREGGSEDRYCGECGEFYQIPLPYEKCSEKTRDLCVECIKRMQDAKPIDE